MCARRHDDPGAVVEAPDR